MMCCSSLHMYPGVVDVQVSLFLLSVLLLFWELKWQPYDRNDDNWLSKCLSGSMCLIAGIEVWVANIAFQSNGSLAKDASVQVLVQEAVFRPRFVSS